MDAEKVMMEIWEILVGESDIGIVRNKVNKILIDYFNSAIQSNLQSIYRKYHDDM